MNLRNFLRIALSFAALGIGSCGASDGRKLTYPVTGKVLVNGKPAEHALIVFHPIGETGPGSVKSRGKVAGDGTFTLTTYDTDDGSPAGNYQVTVELWLASARTDQGPTSRLPAKYAKPSTSGLTATVNAAPTELKPFEIKR